LSVHQSADQGARPQPGRSAVDPFRIRRLALLLVAALVLTLALSARAEAFVYWANYNGTTIGRANLDGSGANQSFVETGDFPCGVAVDATHIYWANFDGTIGRAALDDPGNPDQDFISTGAEGPCGVAVDATHVYWASYFGPDPGTTIGRAALDDPGNPDQDFITGAEAPCGVAVDATHVYWANSGTFDPDPGTTIGRAALDDPGNPDPDFITGANSPCGVAVDSTHLYWANFGDYDPDPGTTIGRAALDDPGNPNQDFITGAEGPCGVAVDATHAYWANFGAFGGLGTTIGRAALDDPGNPNQDFITGAEGPCGVAVDGLSFATCQNVSASTGHNEAVGVSLDCSGGSLTYEIVSDPSAGEISSFDAQAGTLTYTPELGFSGTDSFTYRASNAGGDSNVATATIEVSPAPPLPAPSNAFSFGAASKERQKGKARLTVNVPGAGLVELAGAQIKQRRKHAQGEGGLILNVTAQGAKKQQLKRKGKAKVSVEATFTPDGGEPSTQSEQVKLVKRR
jgi:hypothetical protein